MISQHYLVDGELNEVENDDELRVLKEEKTQDWYKRKKSIWMKINV